MRLAALLALVASFAAPRGAGAQEAADSTIAPPDSAILARLQSELNWRNKIRVLTLSGYFELFDPSVTAEGVGYSKLDVLDAPDLDASSVLQPVPFDQVLEIEVRRGQTAAGIAIGSAIGVISGAVAASGWAAGGDTVGAAIVGGAALGAVGALFGVFLGEVLYTWEPVFAAADR